MPPRELFTVASPAHQDDKGPQRPVLQESPTQPTISAQTQAPSSLYFSPSQAPPALSFVQPANPPQPSGTVPTTSQAPSSPTYPTASAEVNMQNYSPNQNAVGTPPAPLPVYSGQQPQPYYQQNVAQPAHNTMPSPPPIQAVPSMQPQTVQPGAMPIMDVRNVKGLQRDGHGDREWSHGCGDCFDECGTCVLGWCCPCMLYSQIQSRMTHLETRGQPHPEGGDSCTGDCFIHGLLNGCCGLGWVLQVSQRTAVRNRYRIAGDGCSDCMMSYCCTPCELTQVSREIELEEHALMGPPPTQPMQQGHPPAGTPAAFPAEKR